jgi:cysteine-rich repeat protein
MASQQCLCKTGYELQQGQCVEVCGDGILFTAECDDGNTVNGDGCSSACSIEMYYSCSQNSITNVSDCQYVGTALAISLVQTLKTDGLNQGTFTFLFEPPMPLLSHYNFADYFNFQCNGSDFQVVGWEYLNGRATLTVDYLSDMENEPVTVTFGFNQLHIHHAPITLEFSAKSESLPLILAVDSGSNVVLKYLFLIIAAFSLLLLLAGSWCLRMAGVEIVIALQILYFLQFTNSRYTYQFQMFLEMSLLGLSDVFLHRTRMGYLFYDQYQKLPFSLEASELTLVVMAVLMGSLGLVQVVGYLMQRRKEEG